MVGPGLCAKQLAAVPWRDRVTHVTSDGLPKPKRSGHSRSTALRMWHLTHALCNLSFVLRNYFYFVIVLLHCQPSYRFTKTAAGQDSRHTTSTAYTGTDYQGRQHIHEQGPPLWRTSCLTLLLEQLLVSMHLAHQEHWLHAQQVMHTAVGFTSVRSCVHIHHDHAHLIMSSRPPCMCWSVPVEMSAACCMLCRCLGKLAEQ
jgi:hypothetical protein